MPLCIRYQIGQHGEPSWDALDLAVRLMQHLQPEAEIHVTHQGDRLREIDGVVWHRQSPEAGILGRHDPPRFRPDWHEVWCDNDHIMWNLPDAWSGFLHGTCPLVWRTNWRYYGSYDSEIKEMRGQDWNASAGMWGLPPGFGVGPPALPDAWIDKGNLATLDMEQEEMGWIARRLAAARYEAPVWQHEVAAWNPDHPVLQADRIGSCGVHLMGLNRGWNPKATTMLRWIRQEFIDGMVGAWQRNYEQPAESQPYHMSDSYQVGMDWLRGHGPIADWGCGPAYAKRFVGQDTYIGIDGSHSRFADVKADLRTCTMVTHAAFTRHTLEHNLDWQAVLRNFLTGFLDRAVIVTFIPLGDRTRVWRWDDPAVPYLQLDGAAFRKLVQPYLKYEQDVDAGGITETVWFLEKLR